MIAGMGRTSCRGFSRRRYENSRGYYNYFNFLSSLMLIFWSYYTQRLEGFYGQLPRYLPFPQNLKNYERKKGQKRGNGVTFL